MSKYIITDNYGVYKINGVIVLDEDDMEIGYISSDKVIFDNGLDDYFSYLEV